MSQHFKYRDEVDPAEFEETGKNHGGIYSKERWIEHRREVDERVRRWEEAVKVLDSIVDESDTDENWDEALRGFGIEPTAGEGAPR